MKLAIMQPYFFPYVGYFDLIRRADRFIVFDTPQYIRHGWVNRNRILHPTTGWQYVLAPLKAHARSAAIREVELADAEETRQRILRQLQHYRRHAPFYEATLALVGAAMADSGSSLVRLNVQTLARVCAALGLKFAPEIFSEMTLTLGPIEGPGDWALRISEAVGASEYINTPGGDGLFDAGKFAHAGIKLTIQKQVDFSYRVGPYIFEPRLSIIDTLMWNDPAVIRAYLDALP